MKPMRRGPWRPSDREDKPDITRDAMRGHYNLRLPGKGLARIPLREIQKIARSIFRHMEFQENISRPDETD